MKKIGIKILLTAGHFIMATTTEDEARRLMRAWQDNETKFLSGMDVVNGERWDWCVSCSQIVGIHTALIAMSNAQPGAYVPDHLKPIQGRWSGI